MANRHVTFRPIACPTCAGAFLPTKWQRARGGSRCTSCAEAARVKAAAGKPRHATNPGRSTGVELANHLRGVWR